MNARVLAARLHYLILFLVAAVVFPVSVSQAQLDAPELSSVKQTRYFTVHYSPQFRLQAELLSDLAQDELLRVGKELGYTPDPTRPFPLYIFQSHKSFMNSEGSDLGKFTVGTTRSGDETIAIDASGVMVLPREVLSHEITHAVIFRLLGSRISALPLWFNEGLAKYESGAYPGNDDALVAEAAANEMLIPLINLSDSFPEDKTGTAYAISSSAIRYMINKYGPSTPRKVLRGILQTGSFSTAMRKATGLSSFEFGDQWYDHEMERYKMAVYSRVGMAVLSAIMAILTIVAFLRRRRKMAQAAKEWDMEEFEEALRRQQGNDWSM